MRYVLKIFCKSRETVVKQLLSLWLHFNFSSISICTFITIVHIFVSFYVPLYYASSLGWWTFDFSLYSSDNWISSCVWSDTGRLSAQIPINYSIFRLIHFTHLSREFRSFSLYERPLSIIITPRHFMRAVINRTKCRVRLRLLFFFVELFFLSYYFSMSEILTRCIKFHRASAQMRHSIKPASLNNA